MIENLRHAIVREHREFADVNEFAAAFASEFGENIPDENLSSFVEVDLMAFVDGVVLKVRKTSCQNAEQFYC